MEKHHDALVREWMEPSIPLWKDVPHATKKFLWNELKKCFLYPQGMDKPTKHKAKAYAL